MKWEVARASLGGMPSVRSVLYAGLAIPAIGKYLTQRLVSSLGRALLSRKAT